MTDEAARQKREIVLWTLALCLGLWLIWRGYVRVDALVLVAGMVLAATGFALAAGAIARFRLAAEGPAPGVVLIDEGRIGVFGPTGGGFIDLSTLALVAVSGQPGSGDRAWTLRGEDGTTLVIPFGAVGAERIPDALASLPGLDLAAAAEGAGPIWQADGRVRPLLR
ncbi:hypothetical protein [Amaricoccus sp.]|uniref:hypothetical protein n=1 Tax=Amaricoccus sp. TaxID=1872485 RepID=UPI001B534E3C|nr:hypothetical protein [Amaricoccus sp.]MBP7242889.1 hypothetical protein [Amaricoccus sp.]